MRLRRQGSKVVLREKRRTDAPNDYAWSIDEELCRSTRPVPAGSRSRTR